MTQIISDEELEMMAKFVEDYKGISWCSSTPALRKFAQLVAEETLSLVSSVIECECDLEQYGEHRYPELCQSFGIIKEKVRDHFGIKGE